MKIKNNSILSNLIRIILLSLVLFGLLIVLDCSVSNAAGTSDWVVDYGDISSSFDYSKSLKLNTTTDAPTVDRSSNNIKKEQDQYIFYKYTNEWLIATYRNVGQYEGRNVDCVITFRNIKPYTDAEAGVDIGDSEHKVGIRLEKDFPKGFHYENIKRVTVLYTFLDSETKNKIKIDNTFFTVNSLTWNEGVSYLNGSNSREPAYLNKNYFGDYTQIKGHNKNYLYGEEEDNYRYFFGRGMARNSPFITGNREIKTGNSQYDWFDDWTGKLTKKKRRVKLDYNIKWWDNRMETNKYAEDFDKGSVSYLFNGTHEDFTFRYKTKYKYENHDTWVAISTSPFWPVVGESTVRKTGSDTITDVAQRVDYRINYSSSVCFYEGMATVTTVDKLPYPIDANKSNLAGGTYDSGNRTITWKDFVEIGTVNTNLSNHNINISKDISLYYLGINTNAQSMENIVTATVETSPKNTSKTVEDKKKTDLDLKINIIANKIWDDQGRGRSRRSEPLIFVLYQNGNPTNQTFSLSPKTMDSEQYIFKDLPKYDGQGNKYKYEVREITKQSGNNYYRLQDDKGETVQNRSDLRYYIDSTTTSEEQAGSGGRTKTFNIKNTYTSMNISGNVWLDAGIDGRRTDGESAFKGVDVQLLFKHGGGNEYEYYGYTVRTDENGNYSFNDIPWNGTYKIRFLYNGQVYEPTYYSDNLSRGYSNAKEYSDERNRFNTVFENINAYPNNYDNGKRAFGLNEKLKSVATNDFIYDENGNPYVFANDVLSEFNSMENSYNDYNDTFFEGLKTKLQNKNIDVTTVNSLIDYLKDCITYADTRNYSVSDFSSLQPGSNNTISSVDFGLSERVRSNLSIIDDIYKITYIINGKQFDEYDGYNKKPTNIFSVQDRANNEYYNGAYSYSKPIYKSDYLYNGKNLTQNGENRNLQIYVTYKITITNNGGVSATIRSLDNYYDFKNYENFSDTKNLKVCQDNIKLGSFIDEDTNETLKDYKKLKLTAQNPVLIHPGESTDVDLTFKIKSENDRVKLSESKKNIVEINSYSTYYSPEDNVVIPDILQGDNKINKQIKSTMVAGLVDIDSDPGSLRDTDLTDEGDLIYNEQKENVVYQRIENDTDKSPNLNLMLTNETRSISGLVFEDNRNVVNDTLKTSLGNGKYDEGETKINGVTVQLVELVREINPTTQLQTNNYVGEHVWSEWDYNNLVEEPSKVLDEKNYYTGKGVSSVIISGQGDLHVDPIPLGNNEEEIRGKYQFDSFVPGDYYVRFTYGDTNRTVLTDNVSANAKAQSLGQLDVNNNPLTVNSVVNDVGLNSKSYNGQDYKSTIYQPSINQSGVPSYNGIVGFVDTQNQNFLNDLNDYFAYNQNKNEYTKNSKAKLYMYSNALGDSNAKDIYGDRQRIQDRYGEKKASELYDNKLLGINNTSGEILQSYEKLASSDGGNLAQTQRAMLEELKNNTQMRAHSGVIDIEIVHNNSNTNQATLGLTERSKSQIILTKEATALSVTLQNGKVLFNTDKSVSNLYFGKHSSHVLNYDGYRIDTNSIGINVNKGDSQPELIQAYIDDELMAGATLSTRYKITAINVGEVDFNDNEFYYSGVERDPDKNITKTMVNKVVDYIPNTVVFDSNKQRESDSWGIAKVDDLIKNGLVTGKYRSIMNTYNTILVSEGLNKELVPEQYKNDGSFAEVELVLDSSLSNVLSRESLIYNNMTELIQATNQQGRGSNISIPGNEEMADQTLISNAKPGESVLDRRTPKEIDADSAQRIIFMPPTGEEDYSWLVLVAVISAGVIAGGLLIVKKLVFNH